MTRWKGAEQRAWKPKAVYHLIQSYYAKPHFVVDVSAYWEEKMKAVYAFSSQFEHPHPSAGAPHPGAEQDVHLFARFYGDYDRKGTRNGPANKAKYGEGFTTSATWGYARF